MRTLKRIGRYALKYWPLIIICSIFVLITAAIELVWPQVQKYVIDLCLVEGRYDLLGKFAIAIVVIFILRGIFSYTRDYLSQQVAHQTVYDIRSRFFNHIQRLSFAFHDTWETGQLISRSTADTEAIATFIAVGIVHLCVNFLMFTGVATMMLVMNWQLALISFAFLPFMAISVFKYSQRIGPLFTDVQDQIGNITTRIQENAMGIRVVKAFSREDYECKQFDELVRGLLTRAMRVARVDSVYNPLMNFIGSAGIGIVLWFGGYQVIVGNLTLGELVTFNTYLTMLLGPIRIASWLISIVKNAVASADRIFEVLDIRQETHIRDGSYELHECEGRVEFRNVAFAYDDGTHALHDISFEVEPGQTVGIMGPTGSGKTSIFNLIPRFYDAKKGSVMVDGLDVRNYRVASLRRHLGLVAQESFLFQDTVRENIAYGRPTATDEEVVNAAIIADLHDFIVGLPDGYHTVLGERGLNLSGGQKQRLSIARAVLKDPAILLMDDSTSAVDTQTEAHIQKALRDFASKRTTFIIAQRVSSVMTADKIIMLEHGRIVEMGTHEELMKIPDGHYAERYRLQFSDMAGEGSTS